MQLKSNGAILQNLPFYHFWLSTIDIHFCTIVFFCVQITFVNENTISRFQLSPNNYASSKHLFYILTYLADLNKLFVNCPQNLILKNCKKVLLFPFRKRFVPFLGRQIVFLNNGKILIKYKSYKIFLKSK